jgi:hypothetical protein
MSETNCRSCAEGDKPDYLDEDGVKCSISGNEGSLCHAYDDSWWPCVNPDLRAKHVVDDELKDQAFVAQFEKS